MARLNPNRRNLIMQKGIVNYAIYLGVWWDVRQPKRKGPDFISSILIEEILRVLDSCTGHIAHVDPTR